MMRNDILLKIGGKRIAYCQWEGSRDFGMYTLYKIGQFRRPSKLMWQKDVQRIDNQQSNQNMFNN